MRRHRARGGAAGVQGTAVTPASQALAQTGGTDLSASSPSQLALVEILRRKGVLFYGAWWCGHCTHQKRLFGTMHRNAAKSADFFRLPPGQVIHLGTEVSI